MEFLLPFGITKETIAQVIKNNDETLIENLICDQEMVINNLNYFKEIGIKRINDLLIERTDLFLVPTEILKEKQYFREKNISRADRYRTKIGQNRTASGCKDRKSR